MRTLDRRVMDDATYTTSALHPPAVSCRPCAIKQQSGDGVPWKCGMEPTLEQLNDPAFLDDFLAPSGGIGKTRTMADVNRLKRQRRLEAARKLGTHTMYEWCYLVAATRGECPRCGYHVEHFEKDHIVPIFCGGSDAIENIQPLCYVCNRSKNDHVDWMARRGWRVILRGR